MHDFLILGAGIAGLSLADALCRRGFDVVVADRNETGAGASGTPLAMANPATGLRGKKVWRAEQGYAAVLDLLQRVSRYSRSTFYQQNGVLRPALSKKMAGKMRKQFEATTWPDGWTYWLDADRVREKHPGITCVEGGLWLPAGLTVDMPFFMTALAAYLQSQGVKLLNGISHEPELSSDTNGWRLDAQGTRFECARLIYATGYGTVHHQRWDWLPLEGVKGQLMEARPEEPLQFEHSISSRGYIAHISPDRFGVGSTYEHDFSHLLTDAKGREHLQKVMERTLPRLAHMPRKEKLWAGVRVSTPDKKPVLGAHPSIPELFVFTGLGSKGLLYGRYLATLLADHLTTNQPLPDSVAMRRFL